MSDIPDHQRAFFYGWETIENLPFPVVLYPAHGPFICFR